MTNLAHLFKALSNLNEQQQEPDFIRVEQHVAFPFPMAYAGQYSTLKNLKGFDKAAIVSHTGSGKSAIITALTRGESSIIIEPRKFLQHQIQTYYDDFVLFGRSEYNCQFAKNASKAPCNRKIPCDTVHIPKDCDKVQQKCNTTPCLLFLAGTDPVKFPCKDCDYVHALIQARRTLKDKGTIICNFGNFWALLGDAKIVVIDESDLFFREISKPTRLLYSKKSDANDTIDVLLEREKTGLAAAVKKTPASEAYSLQNLLYNISFLIDNKDLCFKYQRKDKIYIEINPINVNVLKDKIFKNKRLLIVSATPGELDIPKHNYTVWQRRGIFYCPVGKMTSFNIKRNPWILGVAAERIETISSIAEGMFDTRKFPIHCGNLGTHAYAINNLLGSDRSHLYCNICGEKIEDVSPEAQEVKCPKCNRKWEAREDVCTMHKAGNLMKTIESFVDNDKRYLLIAGADYGGDFTFAKIQFILKFPYASLDERMRVLERTMGKEKFNEYYINEAISRFVQQCGRVCRGFGDFGATIVLDSKAMEVYNERRSRFPEWFQSSFDGRCY